LGVKNALFWPFENAKTALALAPEGLDPQNVKLGKGKHTCFLSFLSFFCRFYVAFVSFTRVFDTFLHLVKLWITPVSGLDGRLKLNILSVQPEGLRRTNPGNAPGHLGHGDPRGALSLLQKKKPNNHMGLAHPGRCPGLLRVGLSGRKAPRRAYPQVEHFADSGKMVPHPAPPGDLSPRGTATRCCLTSIFAGVPVKHTFSLP
jgi:hypothetical protein